MQIKLILCLFCTGPRFETEAQWNSEMANVAADYIDPTISYLVLSL